MLHVINLVAILVMGIIIGDWIEYRLKYARTRVRNAVHIGVVALCVAVILGTR